MIKTLSVRVWERVTERTKNGGRWTEILTCMRGLEAALLTRRQCRVSDVLVAVMANGHLVFIFTHWINLPFYYHVFLLQHTSLYVKMLSDISTFNLLSIILKLTLISLFTMTQLKCTKYCSFLPKNSLH